MFYSDYAIHYKPKLAVEYMLVFFAAHFEWYANHVMVQCLSYGDIVWC